MGIRKPEREDVPDTCEPLGGAPQGRTVAMGCEAMARKRMHATWKLPDGTNDRQHAPLVRNGSGGSDHPTMAGTCKPHASKQGASNTRAPLLSSSTFAIHTPHKACLPTDSLHQGGTRAESDRHAASGYESGVGQTRRKRRSLALKARVNQGGTRARSRTDTPRSLVDQVETRRT